MPAKGRLDRAAFMAAIPARAAVAALPGPTELTFLARSNITLLEDTDAVAPWAFICRGVGMLGGTATRAIRLNNISTLRRIAAFLRVEIARYLGVQPTSSYDGVLADVLLDFLHETTLSDGLEAHGTTDAEFIAEALDSLYASRSMANRLAVEESRFHLLKYK